MHTVEICPQGINTQCRGTMPCLSVTTLGFCARALLVTLPCLGKIHGSPVLMQITIQAIYFKG